MRSGFLGDKCGDGLRTGMAVPSVLGLGFVPLRPLNLLFTTIHGPYTPSSSAASHTLGVSLLAEAH